MSCMAAVPNVSLAADEQIIPFGAVCSFDKFTLSYKDAQTADVMIAFSEDGTNYGEYQTVSFSNDTDETKYLESTAKAKCAKLRVGSEDCRRLSLNRLYDIHRQKPMSDLAQEVSTEIQNRCGVLPMTILLSSLTAHTMRTAL